MAVIGIIGSYGGLNTGDEAILSAMLATLRSKRPGDEFVVFSRDVEHTRRFQDADRVCASRDANRDELIPEIDRLDLLLLGGGGILYDGEARHYLRPMRVALELGRRTFAYAIGAGPLEGSEDREAVREVLSDVDGITVRDEASLRVLEELGVDRRIEVTADPALLLEPAPFSAEMLREEGIHEGRHLVGISVREPGGAATDLDEEGYHQLLAHAADYVVHRFDADVVFVPLEREDIRHSHAVVANMVGVEHAHVLKGKYSPGQIVGLMERLGLAIGLRLHFLIFAAISGTPFLPLPYASKVLEFAAAVGVEVPGQAHRQSVGPLLASIDRVWDYRERQRRHLGEVLPPLQERARHTNRLALELLGTGSAA